jgi:holo-[acyl-carrier protein] synthase
MQQKIIGVGTDILRISRISAAINSESFLKKVFSEKEQELAKKRSRIGHYYAKLFACKEAVFKSLGIHADNLTSWSNIEVLDDELGQPVVYLHESIAALASEKCVEHIFLSCSYESEYATAFAIAVGGYPCGYVKQTEK